MTAAELALAGPFLARDGLRVDGARLLARSQAKRVNAVMLTCGTYDAAGEFAYRVGLPCKSGVGGGILAVIPDRATIVRVEPGAGGVGQLDGRPRRAGRVHHPDRLVGVLSRPAGRLSRRRTVPRAAPAPRG